MSRSARKWPIDRPMHGSQLTLTANHLVSDYNIEFNFQNQACG